MMELQDAVSYNPAQVARILIEGYVTPSGEVVYGQRAFAHKFYGAQCARAGGLADLYHTLAQAPTDEVRDAVLSLGNVYTVKLQRAGVTVWECLRVAENDVAATLEVQRTPLAEMTDYDFAYAEPVAI